jgi:dihydroorotate dehydrogenase (NAD+) catalytic subunit
MAKSLANEDLTGTTRMTLILSSGKQEIVIKQPILNSAGTLGFSDELRNFIDLDALGAFITNPVSLHPRTPAQGPRLVTGTHGVLLHTGLPNPGVQRVIELHQSRWERMKPPVILHVLAAHQDEMTAIIDLVEGVGPIQALEIGLLDEDHEIDKRIFEAACASMLPAIARLPVHTRTERILHFEAIGAAAIALGAPRGTLFVEGQPISGRLYGSALLAQMVHAVIQARECLSCPLIAGSGVFSRDDAEQLLAAGAGAIELDTVLWTTPESLLDPQLAAG